MHRKSAVRWLLAGLAVASLAASADDPMAGNATGDAVPAYFRQLIEAGNVRFEFYDPRTKPKRYRGFTDFKFWVQQTYAYRYSWTRRGRVRYVTVKTTIRDVSCQLAHTLHLPKQPESDRRWHDPLVKHEFDHVAISVHPRVKMLAEHVLRKMPTIELRAPPEAAVGDKAIRAAIDEAIAERITAINELIGAHQRLLDEVTRHGARRIPDREAFFRSLFTKPSLERAAFPYTSEVLDLLQSDVYRSAKPPSPSDRKEKKASGAKHDEPRRDEPRIGRKTTWAPSRFSRSENGTAPSGMRKPVFGWS